MDDIKELCADIRNKLQCSKTVLEEIQSKRIPPGNIIAYALKDLTDIDVLLG